MLRFAGEKRLNFCFSFWIKKKKTRVFVYICIGVPIDTELGCSMMLKSGCYRTGNTVTFSVVWIYKNPAGARFPKAV